MTKENMTKENIRLTAIRLTAIRLTAIRLTAICLTAICFTATLDAQTYQGQLVEIYGGEPLSGARIELSKALGSYAAALAEWQGEPPVPVETHADGSGSFAVEAPEPGVYRLRPDR